MFTKKVICLVILMVSLSGPASAEVLAGQKSDRVLVFKTLDQMRYAIDLLNKGVSCFDKRFLSTLKTVVPNGTECSIIESVWTGSKKVRIMSGSQKGKIGWVPMEMVH